MEREATQDQERDIAQLARDAHQNVRTINHQMTDKRLGIAPPEAQAALAAISELLISLEQAVNHIGQGVTTAQEHYDVYDLAGNPRDNARYSEEQLTTAGEKIMQAASHVAAAEGAIYNQGYRSGPFA